ncbi:hypothetical protein KI387_025274, partial [Taxus chinensis]
RRGGGWQTRAVRAARWIRYGQCSEPSQASSHPYHEDMEATPYQLMAGIWGEEHGHWFVAHHRERLSIGGT